MAHGSGVAAMSARSPVATDALVTVRGLEQLFIQLTGKRLRD